jgi:hypothetical protein
MKRVIFPDDADDLHHPIPPFYKKGLAILRFPARSREKGRPAMTFCDLRDSSRKK